MLDDDKIGERSAHRDFQGMRPDLRTGAFSKSTNNILEFNSNFENGNLDMVVYVGNPEQSNNSPYLKGELNSEAM